MQAQGKLTQGAWRISALPISVYALSLSSSGGIERRTAAVGVPREVVQPLAMSCLKVSAPARRVALLQAASAWQTGPCVWFVSSAR